MPKAYNEEDISRVAVAQAVLLCTDAFAGRRLDGKVHKITPMGDAAARIYRICIALPENAPLHVGMSVEAPGGARRSLSNAQKFVPNVQVGAARSGGGTRQKPRRRPCSHDSGG